MTDDPIDAPDADDAPDPDGNSGKPDGTHADDPQEGEASEAEETSRAHRTIMRTLDWAYDAAVSGVHVRGFGLDSAEALARDFMTDGGKRHKEAASLIRWQVAKCATSGFVTGLGGVLTLPAAIPANLASVMFVQLRMIAAIAHMGGYDLRDDRVRTLCYLCLAGKSASDIAKGTGVVIGVKMTRAAISRVSGETIRAINRAVGFRLLTRAGRTGAINLVRLVPLGGGLVTAAFDGTTTRVIGGVAKRAFLSSSGEPDSDDDAPVVVPS